MMNYNRMKQQIYPPQQQSIENIKFDALATELYYWQHSEYDFDPQDRPVVFPHSSYGKHVFPSLYQEGLDY